MRLMKLTIDNFKGIEHLAVEPMGNDMAIYGENGTGKTTIADAYAWVLFGKSFSGDSIEPEIKKRDKLTGLAPNDGGIVHAVEAVLETDSGDKLTLRKEYTESWKKRRGAAESEFCGHTTNHYVNNVPTTKRDYDKRMAEILPDDAGRLLSMPLYFCTNLKWQERRKILMQMCGEVTDKDLLESDEYKPLEKLLGKNSVDDFRKTIKSKMKKVNDELNGIPERIDELSKMQAEVTGTTKGTLTEDLVTLQQERGIVALKIARLENGGEAAELQKNLAGIEAEMTRFVAKFDAKHDKEIAEAESRVRGCVSEVERVGAEMVVVQEKIEQLEKINATTDVQAQELRELWNEENAKQPDVDVSEICPYCGQQLPAEKIEEAWEKAEQEFNLKRAETLTEITAKGKRLIETKRENEQKIALMREKLDGYEKRISELADKKEAAQKIITAPRPDAKNDSEYKRMESDMLELQRKIEELMAGANISEEISEQKAYLQTIDADIERLNGKLAEIAQAENVTKRIAELKKRETELGSEYSKLEAELNLAERFVRAKVRATEDAINSHFKYVRFTLFREQINGGLDECCEPTINGVPFGAGLNTGAEMKAALDILNALSEFYGIVLPVIIDNCESYTSASVIPVRNQLIRLVVAEGQKELKVCIDGEDEHQIMAVKRAATSDTVAA